MTGAHQIEGPVVELGIDEDGHGEPLLGAGLERIDPVSTLYDDRRVWSEAMGEHELIVENTHQGREFVDRDPAPTVGRTEGIVGTGNRLAERGGLGGKLTHPSKQGPVTVIRHCQKTGIRVGGDDDELTRPGEHIACRVPEMDIGAVEREARLVSTASEQTQALTTTVEGPVRLAVDRQGQNPDLTHLTGVATGPPIVASGLPAVSMTKMRVCSRLRTKILSSTVSS